MDWDKITEHPVYGDKYIRAPCTIWMGTQLFEHPVYGWGQIY